MKNPSSPCQRRPGPRIDSHNHDARSLPQAASAPQRPILRRRPNRPFRDDLIPGFGLGGLTVDLASGGCRSLQAVLDEEGDR
jgi:hypothetical protein